MSKNAEFKASLQKMRRRVYQMIGERSRQFGEELSKRLCEVFAYRAQQRLIKYSTPKDSVSSAMVQSLAASIQAKQSSAGNGYMVSIPVDTEGLLLFLEYGTGLVGESNASGDSEFMAETAAAGWAYGINRDRYIDGGWYFYRHSQRGRSQTTSYLDAEDQSTMLGTKVKKSDFEFVKAHTRNGKPVKAHIRKRKPSKNPSKNMENEELVFSRGLVPVKFIYNTKQDIRRILDMFRNWKNGSITTEEVFEQIKILEGSAV